MQLSVSCVLKPVVSTVNYIRSHGLNHRQFREFLKDGESEFVDVTYYTAVRWLSCGKVLSRFFNLREEIRKLLADKIRPEPLLSNSEWLWKLAFCVDLTEHMHKLNVGLQGETRLIHDVYMDIKGFTVKLQFFERQVRNQNWGSTSPVVPSSVQRLMRNPLILRNGNAPRPSEAIFRTEIQMFQNPFNCDVDALPSQFQLEFIDLQSNDILKENYKERNLTQFYKS
ncbi:unnamed protein product, partial [Ixodes pacificus]